MLVAGIDIGAATTKAVIMTDSQILSYFTMPTGYDIKKVAQEVIQIASDKAGVAMLSLQYIISTGYGRNSVSFANKAVTEIICHAKGANFLLPETRTIIDIGGQDSKVIGINESGNVINFVMNDKCAAGTGRFLEVMAGVLGLNIEEFGPIALTSKNPCQVSSTCTIFAETEMVSLRAQGRSREDLVAGITKAIASRVAMMGHNVKFRKQVMFTGGVAKNTGVKKALESEIGIEILVPQEPMIVGALGAALEAEAELTKTN